MGLLDNLKQEFSKTSSDRIGQAVDQLVNEAVSMRLPHERRWFDNNFFDDGMHFRIVSKKTGKVLDQLKTSSSYVERAIPRASRQIRGVTNLLFAAEPYPVVYPERVTIEQFRMPDGQVNQAAYEQAMEQAKQIARKRGWWLSTEWDEEQDLPIKLIDALILAAKNSVSWIQVYSDKQSIKTDVYDAFDVVIFGDRRETKHLPFMSKVTPMDINDIKRNPMFNPSMVAKLTPDNKYATSEIKDAYMRARFGAKTSDGKKNGTILVKETFMKEVLTEENWNDAVRLGSDTGAMEGKSKGDEIMRHPFAAGGVTLNDEYIDYDEYPLIPIRFEPGPFYQVPFIERFIPQNKSLDIIVTRLEKWINAMIVGVYQQRKGENFNISNFPGGQKIEYETTPLQQMQTASVGNTPFNVIGMLDKYIEEQGASTSSLGQIPSGVKANIAIENLKATEYSNLKISTLMLKKSMKEISECMLERADKDFLEPKEVSYIEDGEPQYFDVIGQRGFDLSKQINKDIPSDVVPIKKKVKVRIEMEPGLGLTMQGKKEAMQQIVDYLLQLSAAQIVPPEAVKMVTKRFMEVFGYGSTQEFMEVLDNAPMPSDMTEENIMKMKIAIIEALRDAGAVGPEMEKRLVDSTKLGVLETLKDAGMLDKQNKAENPVDKGPSRSISFKDLPPDGKAQLAAQAGIQLNPQQIAQDEQEQKQTDIAMKQKQLSIQEQKAKYPINKYRKGKNE